MHAAEGKTLTVHWCIFMIGMTKIETILTTWI